MQLKINLLLVWALFLVSVNSHADWWDSVRDFFGDKNKVDVYGPVNLDFEQTRGPFAWQIKKTMWSGDDEKKYSEFVARIGAAVESGACSKFDQCMKSPANIYYFSDPSGLSYFSDCADLPYYLRAYFAWKNNLPFSFQTAVTPRNVPGNGTSDIRYNAYGNQVVSREDIVTTSNSTFPDARFILNDTLAMIIGTASFRVTDVTDPRLFTDMYPPEITRRGIRPGTTIYDTNGHVAVVYKITTDGRIYYIDTHPDNSITHGVYGVQFTRDNAGLAAGFKNWRPVQLVGASKDYSGNYIGGQIVGATNQQIPDFSMVQFNGTESSYVYDHNAAVFKNRGVVMPFHDYVRWQMAEGSLQLNPVQEMKNMVHNVCEALKDRAVAVDLAVTAGIHKQDHPDELPTNIYGTEGEWETFSSPSRDARLKVMFVDLLAQTKKFIEKYIMKDASLVYKGQHLAQDLIEAYQAEADLCKVTYLNSYSSPVQLNYEEIRKRLYLLSFDPYHCPELRWGATQTSELRTCQDNSDKKYWYNQEQYLRNQNERRYDVRMNYSADELSSLPAGVGTRVQADTDVISYLKALVHLY